MVNEDATSMPLGDWQNFATCTLELLSTSLGLGDQITLGSKTSHQVSCISFYQAHTNGIMKLAFAKSKSKYTMTTALEDMMMFKVPVCLIYKHLLGPKLTCHRCIAGCPVAIKNTQTRYKMKPYFTCT